MGAEAEISERDKGCGEVEVTMSTSVVTDLQRDLEEAIAGTNEARVMDLLEAARASVKTVQHLTSTSIGRVVGKLRKNAEFGDKTRTFASSLVTKWKQLAAAAPSSPPENAKGAASGTAASNASATRLVEEKGKKGKVRPGKGAKRGKAVSAAESETLRRASKLLLHELMHIFGIDHCIFHECIMKGTGHLVEDFAAPFQLCPVCLRKMQWRLGFNVLGRYRKLLQISHSYGWSKEASWYERRVNTLEAATTGSNASNSASATASVSVSASASAGVKTGTANRKRKDRHSRQTPDNEQHDKVPGDKPSPVIVDLTASDSIDGDAVGDEEDSGFMDLTDLASP